MPRKWSRAHEQQIKRILQLMRAEARPFPDSSDEAVERRKALPFDAWCHTYFPHYCYSPSAPVHLIADDRVEEDGMPVALLFFRGAAKTVRYALLKRVHRIVNRLRHFVVQGARDEEVAAEKLDMIRVELEHNPRLRADYGAEIGRKEGDDCSWVACDTKLLARGIGQSIRGHLYGPHRPDDFNGDDLEDRFIAHNPKREDDLEEWLFTDVYPALEGNAAQALFTLLLNNFGHGALAWRCQERAAKNDPTGRPLMRYYEFPAETADGQSSWAAKNSIAGLRRMAAVMGLREYRREMLLKMDSDGAVFRPEWPQTFDSSTFDRSTAEVRVAADPAVSQAATACFKAIIVLARPIGTADRFCLHAWLRRCSPREFMEHLLWCHDTFRPPRVGCEINGIGLMVRPLLDLVQELQQRVDRIGLYPIANTANKDDRIASVAPVFEQGHAWFDPREGDQQLLLDQFLDYGKTGVAKDGPDAWEMTDRQFPKFRMPGSRLPTYRSGERRVDFAGMLA